MGSHGRILSKGVTGSVLPLRTLPLAQIQRIELTEGLGTGRWVGGRNDGGLNSGLGWGRTPVRMWPKEALFAECPDQSPILDAPLPAPNLC